MTDPSEPQNDSAPTSADSPSSSDAAQRLQDRLRARLRRGLARAQQDDEASGAATQDAAATAGDRDALRSRGDDGPAPLTEAQARLWFLHRLEPMSNAYNIARTYPIRGPLDAARLAR
ncbi:MAG: hypothetical protein AAF772_08870, partial [Acidobacteriota bacterium]